MLIKYEKLEDYSKKLGTIPKESETYISVVRTVDETGVVTPSVVIQVLEKNDKCYMHTYTDLPTFQVIPSDVLSKLPDAENVKKSYNEVHDRFEQTIKQEYDKIINLLKVHLGFTNVIENAIVQ